MAKKVRRVRRSGAQQQAAQSASEQVNETPARRDSTERFRQEYAYVLKDLRHILLLAVAMFILLIVLNLVLR